MSTFKGCRNIRNQDYELEFRGVATIVPNKVQRVPVLIWELDERDLPTP